MSDTQSSEQEKKEKPIVIEIDMDKQTGGEYHLTLETGKQYTIVMRRPRFRLSR